MKKKVLIWVLAAVLVLSMAGCAAGAVSSNDKYVGMEPTAAAEAAAAETKDTTSISDLIRVPFGYLLDWLYTFTNSYGLALILFSLIVKLVLLPMSVKSKKSMLKMSRLHFTQELLDKLAAKGVKEAYITLHVGLGTFRPVKAAEITEHHMHSEFCMISRETADIINETKRAGGRIVCVGTTSCRTLESLADENGYFHEASAWTDIFIYPGYKFKAMDALITNFHLPESTLVMLVSAFADREKILNAYNIAVQERYRFFSFGDAMFIS